MTLAVLPQKLNTEQLKAVTHQDSPLLIVAGAGTGKTTVITQRILWLIEQKLARPEEILALTFTDKAAEEMEERVDRLLPYGYVDLWISTFHSFCQRLLQAHGLDIGLPNDFKLLNQTEQWLLVRQNLDKFNLDYYRPLGSPTKFIRALIKHFSRCKDEEISPEDYLRYAEELKINLDGMEASGGEVSPPARGGVAESRKGEAGVVGDVTTHPPLLEKEGIERSLPLKGEIKRGSEEEIDISEIKRLAEVANAYHVYQQLLLENESLDFGDLINYALKLFRSRPAILEKYRCQFKYILVDEFQDTNWAQYELVKLLAAPKNNLTVVLDDDQAIYRWRGASYNNALQFKKDFFNAREISLLNNYRSAQNILDLAYKFIQLNNPERLEAKSPDKLSKKLKAQTEDLGLIQHLHAKSEQEEVKMVIDKIIELKNHNQFADAITWNDFAVLLRANAQAESFIIGLNEAGIPYNFVASKGLYSKEIILDVLAYLKLLDNYHESLALWRVLNIPTMKIKTEDLMELNRFAGRKAYSLFEAVSGAAQLNHLNTETKEQLVKFLSLLKKHTALAENKGVKSAVLAFLQDFGYNEFLVKKNDTRSFSYLNQLADKITNYEKSFSDKSVKNFMALISLELEAGEEGSLNKETEEGPEAVKLMTVHAAKGLEFKYVFIVNLVDKRFPSLERREPIELPDVLVKEIIPTGDVHLQEERRLFYVAITRAKKGIFFTSAENYGGKTKKKLSRFLYEAGIIESTENTKTRKAQKPPNVETQHAASLPRGETLISQDKLPATTFQLPKSFSYSQLKAYETCPYQYYLAFVLKVPTRGKATFSYGKTMHATLQKFMIMIKEVGGAKQASFFTENTKVQKTQKTLPPLNSLLDLYRQCWLDDWYEDKKQKEAYAKRGAESLKGFYEFIKNDPPQVLELEKSFSFKLATETLKGIIDRVDKVGEKVEIVDYKTGRPKTLKTLEDKDQLLIYQLAVQEVFHWDLEKLTFYYLDDNSAISFLGSQKELEKLKSKITGLMVQIKGGDFTATPSQPVCRTCDFKEICQYRQL